MGLSWTYLFEKVHLLQPLGSQPAPLLQVHQLSAKAPGGGGDARDEGDHRLVCAIGLRTRSRHGATLAVEDRFQKGLILKNLCLQILRSV